ncbi:MAG TPA: hypothetical protein VGP07_22105 [Polyangia bacterium]|jgi:hypothetical protein
MMVPHTLTAPVPDRRAFARDARAGFALARAGAGQGPEASFRVADRVLRLRFAGPALVASLREGLALPRVAAGTPIDLDVGIWDEETTGARPPACPFGAGDFMVRGDVRHPWGNGVHLSYAVASSTLEYADLAERVGAFWIRRPEALEPWRRAAPLRGLLAALAASSGACLAHAAAVGRAGEGLLLAGPGGSGKSTTALAAAARGWSFCGDDFVLIDAAARPPRVGALYATAKLSRAGTRAAGLAMDQFPTLVPPADASADKTVFQVGTTAGLRLRAIVLPSAAGGRGRARLRRASRAEAVRALLPSSLLLLPGATPAARTRLAALAAGLPSFALELGRDPEENVGALAQALDDAGPPRADG